MQKSLIRRRPVKSGDYYDVVKTALFNYYVLIRADLKKRWKKLNNQDRRDAVTALRSFESVFNNPAKYFSRAQTENMWNNSAVEYAKKHNIQNVADVFYIVHGPREQFMQNVKDAVYSHSLYSDLYNLVSVIVIWEYDRTSSQEHVRSNAKEFADKIVQIAIRTNELVDIQESNFLISPIKQILMQKQY